MVAGLSTFMVFGPGCYAGVEIGEPSAEGDGDGDAGDGDGDGGDGDGEGDACQRDQSGAVVRRLSTVEYINTVDDTLGIDIGAAAAEQLPSDLRSDGFSNQVTGLLVTFDHVEAYHDLAQSIVEQLDVPTLLADVSDCADFGQACETSFIEGVGVRVWRRPLLASEVDSLRAIFSATLEEGDDFVTGAGFVLEAMLQAPQFIYRIEDEIEGGGSGAPGDVRSLSDYEVASRLSYLLWSSSPDELLFEAAAAGQLQATEQIEAQVDRMLLDPRARETALRYIGDWLALDGLPSINRDPALYPDFNVELAHDMREETLRVAEELLWDRQAPLVDLLTADFTWATPELATLYGVEPIGEGWQRYELANVPHRRGILTHAGIQAINGHGNRPSIVERGLFILRGMLCSSVSAPPADLDTSMSELEEGKSPRYYSEARLANDSCNVCHNQFDPMGWAFERFDGIGAWSLEDEFGNALQEDGWLVVPGTGEQVPFATAVEFAEVLAADASAARCVGVRKPLQFAVGRPLSQGDSCVADEVAEAAAANGGSYHALVKAIALHSNFRTIRSED